MGYRVSGILKLPDGAPANNAEIEFISSKNFSPLVQELKSNIKCSATGAYDVTLEYGEYAVIVYPGGTYPAALGTIILASDTVAGQDLPTLLQQAGWQPATPEYIQQIEVWLAEANNSAINSSVSASAAKSSENNAKASEVATESDRAEVAEKSASVDAKHSEVVSKAAIVDTKTAQVIAAESVAVAAADTASQKASDAAGHEAVSLDAATRAENAALSMVGAIIDGGECDLSGGVYPQPVSASGITYSTVWFVAVGGAVGGVTYDAGDKLRYTTANSGYYFKVDAKDDVYSVNGEKGAVTVTPEKIGAEVSGTASQLITQHESKPGAHAISGVGGLQAELDGKFSQSKKPEITDVTGLASALSEKYSPSNKPSANDVGAEPAGAVAAAISAHEAKLGAHQISGVAGLREELDNIKAAGGDAVLDVRWLNMRSPMRAGYTAGDGQTLSRSMYPDAFAAIQAGLVPVCTDAEWLADPAKRGCFTLGDGSTTFRVPDYNGMQPGSYGPVYLGGGGAAGGVILRDRLQNIAGSIGLDARGGIFGATPTGAFKPGAARNTATSGVGSVTGVDFDASLVARTGDTTRPITVEGCLAIKLFGALQNACSADASALATAVADLSARMLVVEGRVATLEQRKSTCLVNATGTGAPHETVVAQLPANIAINSRYVLPNPFGNNTPVICWAEVFANGVWSNAGCIYSGGGCGTGASYVQGVGVVIQTGGIAIITSSNNSGGGHGINTNVVSAPCRVFVRKLEA